MALNNTGVLDFYWPEVPLADFYKVKFYKNDTYSFLASTATTGYQVTGLYEGDVVGGDVYHIIDDQPSLTGYSLTPQSVDVFNFHSVGSGLAFSGISVNGRRSNFILDQNVTVASGSYLDTQASIELNINNPRDNSKILYFKQEPFLTGIKYRTINNLSDNTDFIQVDSLSLNAQNPDNTSRSFIAQVVLEDYYSSGVTGNIYLDNEPISVVSVSKSTRTENSNLVNDFYFSYNNQSDYAEYSFYENSFFTGSPIVTGYTNSPRQFTVNFPLDTTGYFKLTPYDWFGSGISFYDPNYIYKSSATYTPTLNNTFTTTSVNYVDDFGIFEVFSNYANVSTGDSSIYLSIDSGISSNFDSNSFFTGQINPGSGYLFNYFNYLNEDRLQFLNGQKKQPFFVNLKLYESGTQNLEDSTQIQFNAAAPKISSSGIEFDYQEGETTINFLTNPHYTYSGVDILLSGKNFNDYELYSGNQFTTGEIDYYADIKLVHSSNNSFVFDHGFVSGSGLLPRVNFSVGALEQSDASIFFDLTRDVAYSPITRIQAFGKYTLSDLSTGDQNIGDALTEFLLFEDFNNHLLRSVPEGTNLFQAPTGLHANTTYESNGVGFTGFYESGSHFMYRFLPYNGYGSGYVTEPIFINFTSNANSQQQQQNIDDLTDTVNGLESSFTKLYSDNVPIPSGSSYINVDYSIAGFTTEPHVVGTLSTTNQDDPILGLIVSGEPTTGSATFVLSDTAESNGYKLKYLAAEA